MRQLDLLEMFAAAEREPQVVRVSQAESECALLRQWGEIKGQYPDALLLFRVGDFYEAYKEDAREACRILNITLTHRGKSGFEMCGFPFHALDCYLPRLVRAGKRVAICDEIREPNCRTVAARGGFRRAQ